MYSCIKNERARFPNAGDNADELRQLKAEIYKTLLKVVSGAKMIALADKLMRARVCRLNDRMPRPE